MPVEERAALLTRAGAVLAEAPNERVALLTAENGKLLSESAIDFAVGGQSVSTYGSAPRMGGRAAS